MDRRGSTQPRGGAVEFWNRLSARMHELPDHVLWDSGEKRKRKPNKSIYSQNYKDNIKTRTLWKPYGHFNCFSSYICR